MNRVKINFKLLDKNVKHFVIIVLGLGENENDFGENKHNFGENMQNFGKKSKYT